ncbi:MAG: hypothetical protein HFE57_02600 [Firmicutes bacterium]|jgi:hypothetical protein|nr:hypothetical protein [Bacillota bacterium]
MKITSSTVAMQSERQYTAVRQEVRQQNVQYITAKPQENNETESTEKSSLADTVKSMIEKQAELAGTAKQQNTEPYEDELSLKVKLMEKMLSALSKITQRMSGRSIMSLFDLFDNGNQKEIQALNTNTLTPGKWVRNVKTSSFFAETEHTTFSTVGVAKTADGREINFNIDLEMSRAFEAQVDKEWQEDVVFTDPLVINIEDNNAELSDQKFMFDIDGDGNKESISRLQKGSGYLAYDKNGNGIIDDGNELFGAKTGNGFAELAAYDADGNGWIDENDPIFEKLKIWTQDSSGNTKLIGLADADVGAIYLGNVSTNFTLKSEETGATNGQIRNTGFYLKESGGSGTVQHVDVAV